MSDDEIKSIQDHINQFKLPVGTSQLVTELQNRLTAIKVKRQPMVTAPDQQKEMLAATSDPSTTDLQALGTQIKEYFEQLSGRMGEQLAQLAGVEEQPASLLYEKIEDPRVRRQLLADNMRMEGALRRVEFLPDFHEEQAFRRFCTFAAFQVEEMLNYYYFLRYGHDIPTLIADFKQLRVDVKGFGDDVKSIKSIDQIRTYVKIKAYNQEIYGMHYSIYNTLANIRNMEEHRCTVLLNSTEALPSHENFAMQMIRERNHTSVRDYLARMYNNITR
ncbi:hypothetical protein [Hymenobacter sp. 102]|uniref:hypothetical protein n=1 Tax=Hymenobacter sp. 102 TaxID=3403152 RepID=UPI003CFB1FE8